MPYVALREPGANGFWHVDRPDPAILLARDARGRHGSRCHHLGTPKERERVADRPSADSVNDHVHVELVLELQRRLEVDVRVHARQPEVMPGRDDAHAHTTPERVLGLFHVFEVPAEVHDPGKVGFVKLHASRVAEFSGHRKGIRPWWWRFPRGCRAWRTCQAPRTAASGR